MVSLADVLRRHGPDYLHRHGDAVLPSHVRAIRDITQCRTPDLGGQLVRCIECSAEHLAYHSCRNRACPRCGHGATEEWLAQQRQLLLPVRYFHVVFTLPDELRRVVRSHQQALLSALMQAAFESLARLCKDPHYLGAATIGALAVLHTWTRTGEWHPHVHLLVPAGGLAPDGVSWVTPPKRRRKYLVPVKALSVGFRGSFLRLARARLPEETLPEVPDEKHWVVFAKPAVQGADKVLDYLGRYVHRTALSDKAILADDHHGVTFSYRRSQDGQRRTMTLPPAEFLRRFLQHVPPKGFHRVRTFGLLHPAHRETLHRLQLLLAPAPAAEQPPGRPVRRDSARSAAAAPESTSCGACPPSSASNGSPSSPTPRRPWPAPHLEPSSLPRPFEGLTPRPPLSTVLPHRRTAARVHPAPKGTTN
ncbi:MAG: IS91 family transposase [Polyangiaceae bacterium]